MNPVHSVIRSTTNYLYLTPSPPLRKVISHYTISTPADCCVGKTVTIIPDASGCLVFSLLNNDIETLFWGPSTRQVCVENDVNTVPLRIFVEFLPGGAYELFDCMPLSELQNVIIPLAELDNAFHGSVLSCMEQHAFSLFPLIAGLDTLLVHQLFRNARESTLFNSITGEAVQSRGSLRMAMLSKRLSYSERQINRICLQRIGMPYKSFSRILRVNEACNRMKRLDGTLTSLAQELGYCDQSHFTRDFKSLCGLSPVHYLQKMSLFYNEEVKICINLPGKYSQEKCNEVFRLPPLG